MFLLKQNKLRESTMMGDRVQAQTQTECKEEFKYIKIMNRIQAGVLIK